MKIGLYAGMHDDALRFIRQMGLRQVISAPPATPEGVFDLPTLLRMKSYVESFGLQWEVIENLPTQYYYRAMWGLPGRDEQIEKCLRSIRNVGAAGIPVLQYGWMILGGLRTEYSPTGRGGSRYSRFDLSIAEQHPLAAMDWLGTSPDYPRAPDRSLDAEEAWEHYSYFLRCLVPVAEEAGVKLAIHPDDPPIPQYMGVARIISSLDALQRVIDTVPSPNNGLGFCQGTIATMAGVDVVEAIYRFGRQNKIFFAHLRNPRGQVPRFDEVFPDEGDTDLFAAVRAYRDVGFDGVVRIDHCPSIVDDNDRAERSFAYQTGYAKGLVHALRAFETDFPRPQPALRGGQ